MIIYRQLSTDQTTRFKWVRAMPPALFTGVHIDRVYMGRGSQRMLTAWIPIGARI